MILAYTLVAYFTNASCTLASLLKPHPISKKILGTGKTIEGILLGLNAGLLIGLLLKLDFRLTFITTVASLSGDLIGSFIKRRLKIPQGNEVPLMDQLGFLVTTYLALSYHITINFYHALMILSATYFIHKAANKLAYALKLKKVPW
ncbi:MAG TPA: CDP-archaeol synthase [Candidatus Nanoarchaeia archaeon]|nr:CDP-archaeol synthase [Candidatus Nanoarchaeia archaeon]